MKNTIKFLSAVLFLFSGKILYAQSNELSLRDNAEKYFALTDYTQAQNLYKQLLEINPDNITYNAKFGICLFNTDTNKFSCIKYLEIAAKDENFPLSFIYLAKAYHLNYKFDDAISYYRKYKLLTTEKDWKIHDISRQIEMCENGKELIKNPPAEADIISRKTVSREFFTSAYDLLMSEAKVYSIPGDFKSDLDEKQKLNSAMCLYNFENESVYASYGKTGSNGKDIYRKVKLKSEWSKPKALDEINTAYDEDYPFVVSDGNLLYFSSKGHNSMGGYDIFKSIWNPETGTWGAPENLGFPVNSPFDDLLFIPNREAESAYFASDRNSTPGKIEIFKIQYRSPVIIRGKFQVVNFTVNNKAQIKVFDVAANKLNGIYNSSEKNGIYVIALIHGGKYKFLVRARNFAEHSLMVDVPVPEAKYTLKQIINAEKGVGIEMVIAYNFFRQDESESLTDKFLDTLSEGNITSEFLDILDHHANVNTSEIYQEDTENKSETIRLTHKKGEEKVKVDIEEQRMEEVKMMQEVILAGTNSSSAKPSQQIIPENEKVMIVTKTSSGSRIPEHFREADKNNDGKITSEETVAAIDSFFEGATKMQVPDILSLIDYFFDQ